jgi:hypothetical protein
MNILVTKDTFKIALDWVLENCGITKHSDYRREPQFTCINHDIYFLRIYPDAKVFWNCHYSLDSDGIDYVCFDEKTKKELLEKFPKKLLKASRKAGEKAELLMKSKVSVLGHWGYRCFGLDKKSLAKFIEWILTSDDVSELDSMIEKLHIKAQEADCRSSEL